jgi:mRNA-degrading endonuclease RelE of RelBE toxin-antitoxin system
MFRIAFTESALEDIAWFRKREQTIIFDRVEEQLAHEPNVETRNRKRLRPNKVAQWEVRIDTYRVFYDVDVDAGVVEVKMVGSKKGNKLLVRGKEFTL